jgi:hypothetical protein
MFVDNDVKERRELIEGKVIDSLGELTTAVTAVELRIARRPGATELTRARQSLEQLIQRQVRKQRI